MINWLRRKLRQWLQGEDITGYNTWNAPSPVAGGGCSQVSTTITYTRADNGFILRLGYEDANGRYKEHVRLVHDGEDLFEALKAFILFRGLM